MCAAKEGMQARLNEEGVIQFGGMAANHADERFVGQPYQE